MPPIMKLIDSTPRSPFQKLNISDTSIRTVSTAASSASESGGHGGRGRKLSLLSRFRGQNSKKGLPKSKPELSKQTSSGTFSFSSSFSFPSKQESSVELTKQELVESSYNRQDEESILSCYLEEDDSIASASSSSSSSSAWARAPDDDEGTVVEKLEAALADDDGTVISSSRMSVNFSEISHTQQQQQQHSSKNSGSPTPRIITTQSQESSATKQKEFQKQRLFWQNAAMKRSVLYGSKHVKTAETLLDLGNAQMACEEYVAAGKTFLSALKIVMSTHGDKHLSVALALDKLGMAACKTNANLGLALAALEDAFQIRRQLLGLEHLDTVNSLHNIAGVRLNLKQYDLAAKDYYAVLVYRMEFFGPNHIRVADTAFLVAWILETFLHQSGDAREFYLLSLASYQAIHLGESPRAQMIRNCLSSHGEESRSCSNSKVEDPEDEVVSFLPPSLTQQSRGPSRRVPMDAC